MGARPQSEDTAPEAERVQFAIYGRMTAAEKIERIRALCRTADRLALAGLRRRHPGDGEDALRDRLIEIRVGKAAWRQARSFRDA